MQYHYHSNEGKSVVVQYFRFEKDFVEDGIRCVPMIVRYKLDLAGVKLKLKEWSLFEETEREMLAHLPCHQPNEISCYRNVVVTLIKSKCNAEPGFISIVKDPAWMVSYRVDPLVAEQAEKYNFKISVRQWAALNILQRFALLKLCRAGHENRNFPLAIKEFKLA